jgi:hypothetical protein
MQSTSDTGGTFVHGVWTLAARLAAVAAGLLVMSLLVVTGSRAAFNATTTNDTNNFAAGTVVLADDDAGSVMFNLTGMKPGDTSTKCVNVTYTGSLAADVKLYGTVGGTGLGTYLDTVVDIGTGATGGAAMDCTGFAGPTNLHTGTLAAFGAAHSNYGNGAGGYAGVTGPVSRSYRVTVTLQDDNAAQGLTASATFTWEAQNT